MYTDTTTTATPVSPITVANTNFNRTPVVGDTVDIIVKKAYRQDVQYFANYSVTSVDGSNATLTTSSYVNIKGERGQTGATGPQGPEGPTGPQGPVGPDKVNMAVYAQDSELFNIVFTMIIDPSNHNETISSINTYINFIESLGFSSEQTYMPANGWISEGGTKRQVVGVYADGGAAYAVTDSGSVSEIDLNGNGAFSECWYG